MFISLFSNITVKADELEDGEVNLVVSEQAEIQSNEEFDAENVCKNVNCSKSTQYTDVNRSKNVVELLNNYYSYFCILQSLYIQ